MSEFMSATLAQFAKTNAQAIQKSWGKDGSDILSVLATNAGIQSGSNDGFGEFWLAYPKSRRKVDRLGCSRLWVNGRLGLIKAEILTALEAQKTDRDWTKDGGMFIPAPAVWLRQRRWEAFGDETGSDIFLGAV